MIYNYSISKIMGTGMGYDDTELRREISDIKTTLDSKANVEQVPTKISELSNDANFVTQETVNALDARVTALENDVTASNQTINEINSMI